MATTPIRPDPSTKVRMSDRLWSEQVSIADPEMEQRKDKAYEFSNGRKFEQPRDPYNGTST